MNKFKICILLLLLPLSGTAYALSLADVHHQIRLSVTEIEVLKNHYSPNSAVRTPGIQVGKTNVHAYTKALELLAQIQKFQREKQLPLLNMPPLPQKRVRSKHVLALIELAQVELRIINAGLNLNVAVIEEETSSKTASDLYEEIWKASYLMGVLIEPIKPSDVMDSVLMIEVGLKDIATRRNKTIPFETLHDYSDKQAVDVTISVYKLLYQIAKLERKLKLKPLLVPAFPAGNILSEDAFYAAGNVIADLTRIALKLKIAPIEKARKSRPNVTANQVYAQVERLNKAVAFLLK